MGKQNEKSLMYFFGDRSRNRNNSNSSVKLFEVFISQVFLIACHWSIQALDGDTIFSEATRLFISLMLPKMVYAQSLFLFISILYSNRIKELDIIQFVFPLISPLLLITGPGSPLVLILSYFQICFLVKHVAQKDLASYIWILITWSSLSMSFFFATGHESSFNKLHYASPFVGFDEFGYYRGAIMMGFNTFGSYIIIVMLLPLVIKKKIPKMINKPFAKSEIVFILSILFSMCQCLRAIVMTGFVAIERRHLMVWAIFAPKYIFDVVTLLVVEVTVGCFFIFYH